MKKQVNQLLSSPYAVVTLAAVIMISLVPFFGLSEYPDNSTPYPEELYALCFDGIDNDGDGFSDANDPDCPRCFDGIDNDGDGFVDESDPDCPAGALNELAVLPEENESFFGGDETNDSPFGGSTDSFGSREPDNEMEGSSPINNSGMYVGGGAFTTGGYVGPRPGYVLTN